MGKGGGCFPSKKRDPIDVPVYDPPIPDGDNSSVLDQNQLASTGTQAAKKLKVLIIFYSMYGHVGMLAKRIKKGVDSVDGVEGVLYRVPETLPMEVLRQMKVPQKGDEVPVIAVGDLVLADGLLFGFPTRFGSMASQMKAFFDSTFHLWEKQALAGVPAGFFVSSGTQGGGQESTAWTAITQLAHHGMVYVPIGYTYGARMFDIESLRGGSPYGAGVFSGDGTREPTETEFALAEHQGKYMAAIVKKYSPN